MTLSWQDLKTALGADPPHTGPNAWILDGGTLGRFLCSRYFGISTERKVVRDLLAAFNLDDAVTALAVEATVRRCDGKPPTTFASLIPDEVPERTRSLILNKPIYTHAEPGNLAFFDCDGDYLTIADAYLKPMEQAGAVKFYAKDKGSVVRCNDADGALVGIVMPVRVS